MVGLGDLRQVVAQKIWIVVGGGVRFGVAGTQPATDAPRGLRRTDAQIHALPGAKASRRPTATPTTHHPKGDSHKAWREACGVE